jgi:hypothetical protein
MGLIRHKYFQVLYHSEEAPMSADPSIFKSINTIINIIF